MSLLLVGCRLEAARQGWFGVHEQPDQAAHEKAKWQAEAVSVALHLSVRSCWCVLLPLLRCRQSLAWSTLASRSLAHRLFALLLQNYMAASLSSLFVGPLTSASPTCHTTTADTTFREPGHGFPDLRCISRTPPTRFTVLTSSTETTGKMHGRLPVCGLPWGHLLSSWPSMRVSCALTQLARSAFSPGPSNTRW